MITGSFCEALTAAQLRLQKDLEIESEQDNQKKRREFVKRVVRCLLKLDLDKDMKITSAEAQEALTKDDSVLLGLEALDIDISLAELLELIARTSTSDETG